MEKKLHSMKWKLLGMMAACWGIPVTLVVAVMGVYLARSHSSMTAANYRDQVGFNASLVTERLDQAIGLSRQASYDGTLLEARKQFESGEISYVNAHRRSEEYLAGVYQNEKTIAAAIVWFPGGERLGSAAVYNERAGGSYATVTRYWERSHEAVMAYAEELSTNAGFFLNGSDLYLVRNLVDSHFVSQGVLVLVLNRAYCFESILKYPSIDGAGVWLDEAVFLPLLGGENEAHWDEVSISCGDAKYHWNSGRLSVTDSVSGDRYTLRIAATLKKEILMFPFQGYPYLLGGMVAAILVLMILMLRAFRREISDPVSAISAGAGRIEEGELGSLIQYQPTNLEFNYITESFNHMSLNLKAQFERIYEEEIALREARIKALQSNINPHFLNNTLETINWESRLAGNEKVSKMIEALSTMLDAALDRRIRPTVTLQEEMGYVDAYLYIMKERLGDRLTVEIDMPRELTLCQVPRLVLQPVMENAIEHGVVRNGSGTVRLRGSREGEYLYLDVTNDGGLTPEDEEKIAVLLGSEAPGKKESSVNIGIANVNQRLRILFGPPCGLTITCTGDNVLARLTVPWNQETAAPSAGKD